MALKFTLDDDIDALFADSPHTITVGENTEPCLFDEFDESVMEGQLGGELSNVPRATVKTSTFPNIEDGDTVVIADGEADDEATVKQPFTVWQHVRIDDGALTLLFLRPEG